MLPQSFPNPLTEFLLSVFIGIAILITFYTCNFYYLVFLSKQKHKSQRTELVDPPTVTIQLPIYNERYVAARLVNAVCAMDYPKEKMNIQVLDDSDDDTYDILEDLVVDYHKKGFDISHIRREKRNGYKAGALRKAQALSLDFHFLIEQKAKSNSHLFMNFNGTAGIWRKECIDDAGGWHTATLVEDLDLSYRAQMKGWKCVFLPGIVVDAELPVQMNAAKRQQFRWAKGSMQCAIKLLGDIVIKKIPIDTKIQAFVQLTRHIVHPLMLIHFLIMPILLAAKINIYLVSTLPLLTIAAYFAIGPLGYLMIIRDLWGSSWKSKALAYLYLIIYTAGMSVNNTVAVFDALFGKKNEFLRTPKYGIVNKTDDWRDKAYNLPFTKTTLLEIFFGFYGVIAIFIAIFSNNPVFIPILGIQALGFFYISYLSISHSTFKKSKSQKPHKVSKVEKMANGYYKLAVVGIIGFIIFGVVVAIDGYKNSVYPLEESRGILSRIQATSDTQQIITDLRTVKVLLPKEGNPVWIFPTYSTDFGLIQKDLDTMISTVDKISTSSQDSAAFHTGMFNMHFQAQTIFTNLMDAIPYMYVSLSNIIFSSVWIGAIIGIFAVVKRKKEHLKSYELSDEV